MGVLGVSPNVAACVTRCPERAFRERESSSRERKAWGARGGESSSPLERERASRSCAAALRWQLRQSTPSAAAATAPSSRRRGAWQSTQNANGSSASAVWKSRLLKDV